MCLIPVPTLLLFDVTKRVFFFVVITQKRVGVAYLSVGVRQELHLEMPRSWREAHDEDGGTGHLGGDLAVGGSHALPLMHLFRYQYQCQIPF